MLGISKATGHISNWIRKPGNTIINRYSQPENLNPLHYWADYTIIFTEDQLLCRRKITADGSSSQHRVERTGDRDINKISGQDVSAYLAWLRTDYTPHRFGGKDHPLSPKTLRNVWMSFSSFFKWAERELGIPYPMREIPTPRYPKSQVPEFTREEVERMLKACLYKREANTVLRRAFVMRRSTAARDTALLLLLLDTGVRASELCDLKIGDLDLKTGRVEIKNGVRGGAKGGKGRTVYLGQVSPRALWL